MRSASEHHRTRQQWSGFSPDRHGRFFGCTSHHARHQHRQSSRGVRWREAPRPIGQHVCNGDADRRVDGKVRMLLVAGIQRWANTKGTMSPRTRVSIETRSQTVPVRTHVRQRSATRPRWRGTRKRKRIAPGQAGYLAQPHAEGLQVRGCTRTPRTRDRRPAARRRSPVACRHSC